MLFLTQSEGWEPRTAWALGTLVHPDPTQALALIVVQKDAYCFMQHTDARFTSIAGAFFLQRCPSPGGMRVSSPS